ncbi:hypothetical protein IAI10_03505 [Clostridium sp. 19966]|uniref:hypothetical protein n=1 Tax=Clostridium sp. 19966 TaxID=2768166 RepID=UPI0028DDF691|nr:hypothetical protein [Clostridium sp. 19966]MDT8715722.1 hypothetical protein [Clostridium sp. 19966]
MKQIDKKETSILLANLDKEISIKCIELSEKKRAANQKKIFFISCVVFIIAFILQVIFSLFDVSHLISIWMYLIGVSLLILTTLFTTHKGGILR